VSKGHFYHRLIHHSCSLLYGIVPSTGSEKKKAIPSSTFMNVIWEHLGDTEDIVPDELGEDQVDDTENMEEDEYEEDVEELADEGGEEFDEEMD